MIRCIWIGVMLFGLLGAAPARDQWIELCHIANAGFAVRGPEGTVIVDGMFRAGLPDYQRASDATNELMESAAPPLDDVRIVIASHAHADHFSAEALVRHAAHSPRTHYIMPPQARERMVAAGLPQAAAKRVHGVYPANDRQKRITHAGIAVTVYRISHGKDHPAQNIGTLIEIGGFKVFHTGDMEPYPEELAEAGLKVLRVDVLLAPFWLFMNGESSKVVRDAFGAVGVVPMHVPDKEQSWMKQYGGLPGIRNLIESNVPNAHWISDEMKCGDFE